MCSLLEQSSVAVCPTALFQKKDRIFGGHLFSFLAVREITDVEPSWMGVVLSTCRWHCIILGNFER